MTRVNFLEISEILKSQGPSKFTAQRHLVEDFCEMVPADEEKQRLFEGKKTFEERQK
jgi:hypothetical protein